MEMDSGQMLEVVFLDLKSPLIKLTIVFFAISISFMAIQCYSVGEHDSMTGESEAGVPRGSCP